MNPFGLIMRSCILMLLLCAIASWPGCAKSPSEAKTKSEAMSPEVAVVSEERTTTAEAIPSDGSFLQPLGARPLLGRDFMAGDFRRENPVAAIISSEFWAAAFASRPDVLGHKIQVAAQDFVIIGIAPSTPSSLAGRKVWLAQQN